MALSKGILVPVTQRERNQLAKKAAEEGVTVNGLIRRSVGLPVASRGGARKGAGRPPKQQEELAE